MNRAALLMAIGEGPPIEFVASATTTSGVTTLTKPSGLEVGDLVMVAGIDSGSGATLSTTSGSSWTKGTVALSGETVLYFYKFLTATDVANAWTFSAGLLRDSFAVLWKAHGATTVTLKATSAGGSGSSTETVSGFTKAAGHYGVVSILASRTATTFTAPTGFTLRGSMTTGDGLALADQLYGYVDGASVSWTGLSSGILQIANLFEVTGP